MAYHGGRPNCAQVSDEGSATTASQIAFGLSCAVLAILLVLMGNPKYNGPNELRKEAAAEIGSSFPGECGTNRANGSND